MPLNFNDKSMILNYLQIKLKEQYNPNIRIDNKYYTNIYNKYGFAHFVAKYLNTMYPPMDDTYNIPYDEDDTFANTKSLTDCISILNYFLCDNKGNKLQNDYIMNPSSTSDNSIYKQIYGNDVCRIFDVYDPPLMFSYQDLIMRDPDEPAKYFIKSKYLKPLIDKIKAWHLWDYQKEEQGELVTIYGPITKTAKSERIYYIQPWKKDKEICEIDDYVLSYLLGRTITPYSSMEDIYYVQKLMITSNTIATADRGIWNSPSGNLTDIIMNYQRTKVNLYSTTPIFVTGYFDIYTEASILKDRGEQTYGIYGL